MTTCRIYRGGAAAQTDVDVEAALAAVGEPDTIVWLDVSVDELVPIADRLGFHHHAVEDAVKSGASGREIAQRTKLDRYPGHVFLYLYTAALDDAGELHLREAPAFANRRLLVTVQRDHAYDVRGLTDRWDAHPDLMKAGVPALLYGLLDLVVDSHLGVVDQLADQVDAMEDLLFDQPDGTDSTDGPRGSELPRRAFATRKALVRMRRVVQPMRELVGGITRYEENDETPVDALLMPYYQDVYDHVLRISDTLDGLRDLITTIYETRIAMADHTLNTVMKKLTAWAAIIAVPTAVTGFYGQNVPYPGFLKPWGFWFSTMVWVSMSVALYVGFRSRRWL